MTVNDDLACLDLLDTRVAGWGSAKLTQEKDPWEGLFGSTHPAGAALRRAAMT